MKMKMHIDRIFTTVDKPWHTNVKWSRRRAEIIDSSGKLVFEQDDIRAPSDWSQMALNVVASKYFRGHVGEEHRENDVQSFISRVVDTITDEGLKEGYFVNNDSAESFRNELSFLIVQQAVAFNSPVWFNVGITQPPQSSACFINSVEDNMGSIMDLVKREGFIFKGGSGAGSNLSKLRGSMEKISIGGFASGPVSFMRGYDSFAGVIKSGGATRRAAKMVLLDVDHPDIVEFIECKVLEEKRVQALIEAGYSAEFNVKGNAYESAAFQNANHSVRVSDKFMRLSLENPDSVWNFIGRKDGEITGTIKAGDLLDRIAKAAWECGDPGIQFDDTINNWHTCPNTDKIWASNPCGEYVFLNDSACNLASINLTKFVKGNGSFDITAFEQCVHLTILAQEILVGLSSYPNEKITETSINYRTLGLGYANLGAVLMSLGIPYDSQDGRDFAASITSLMSSKAYCTSGELALCKGAFSGWDVNKEPMKLVMEMHHEASNFTSELKPDTQAIRERSQIHWNRVKDYADSTGFRNAQISLLAPTGTISFMMGCDTTGIEPDLALVKWKKLVGGGTLKIVNSSIKLSLERLGYNDDQCNEIEEYIHRTGTVEGSALKAEHYAVFDTALQPEGSTRMISPSGHIRMMAAVQPFLSGAISKTVNLPSTATVDDIKEIYEQAWILGLKAVAVYRDGCKSSQAIQNRESKAPRQIPDTSRKRLPSTRKSLTHRFNIQGHDGYITVGMYEDGSPGEVFLIMNKEGSTISGLMDTLATVISMALQYGVPLEVLVKKLSHVRFEPSGITDNKDIPFAKSVTDYVFRYLASQFSSSDLKKEVGIMNVEYDDKSNSTNVNMVAGNMTDAPPCPDCGSITVRNGSCYRCISCGTSLGCS